MPTFYTISQREASNGQNSNFNFKKYVRSCVSIMMNCQQVGKLTIILRNMADCVYQLMMNCQQVEKSSYQLQINIDSTVVAVSPHRNECTKTTHSENL